MIDGLIKHILDPLWEKASTPLVRAGLTPNQVTLTGLALIIAGSGLYLWHRLDLVFGLWLAVSYAFDALDGAVARRRDMRSKAGGYLDAMVDRYQELIVLGAIAWVHDLWPLALLTFAGSVITSYAKARTALEADVSNDGWPELFERLERIIYTCVLLVAAGLVPEGWVASVMVWGMALFAALTNLTALQRGVRAFGLLAQIDREGGAE
ncbi:CDP-alcohol phosphatidyltransferase family protein [Pseudooceanicola sp.]|uniref:CDP-alcohol phosphatidyltransferase family protein n=1 Tax=Pseudooceanicola sp. TaxID=1914328 RepID=UPI002612673C|nr:CDP-alcohol phosphatidyltransferase family protein [Pseudooceanicola sp.]MDF1856033.1 CDP-alcohol phosphatidyltransferase family protein [Pseudooceanicola sp.]